MEKQLGMLQAVCKTWQVSTFKISSGQTSRIGAKIGAGLRNVGAEAGKSGTEVGKSRQKSETLGNSLGPGRVSPVHPNAEQQKSDEENCVKIGKKTTTKNRH